MGRPVLATCFFFFSRAVRDNGQRRSVSGWPAGCRCCRLLPPSRWPAASSTSGSVGHAGRVRALDSQVYSNQKHHSLLNLPLCSGRPLHAAFGRAGCLRPGDRMCLAKARAARSRDHLRAAGQVRVRGKRSGHLLPRLADQVIVSWTKFWAVWRSFHPPFAHPSCLSQPGGSAAIGEGLRNVRWDAAPAGVPHHRRVEGAGGRRAVHRARNKRLLVIN